MPQASNKLRKAWGGQSGVGEDKAEAFLKSHGFILLRNWFWELPPERIQILRYKAMTLDEVEAMTFLVEEWDYGGLFNA